MSITGLILVQCFLICILACLFSLRTNLNRIGSSSGDLTTAQYGRTAVILCVRGADPSLLECLSGLSEQTHANYRVHIVIDSPSDPATPLITRFTEGSTRFCVQYLNPNPSTSRGLKVSAILEALHRLESDVEYVAFIDADVNPHPHWLQQLTTPLQDLSIGITTGTRWFEPSVATIGSMVRAEWNLYAVALMARFNIVWGGSFAIRRSLIYELDLPTLWHDKLCEDTCLGDALRQRGLQCLFVPAVSMINRECCRISGAASFITRQMVFTRLHSKKAGVVLGFCLIYSACCLLSPLMVLVAAFRGDLLALSILGPMAAIFYCAATVYEITEDRRPFQWTGQAIPRRSTSLLKLHFAQLVCSAVSFWSVLRALSATTVFWRGIEYRIGRRASPIETVEYKPYSQTQMISAEAETPAVFSEVLCEELSI